jgi:glyoxylase-like metal-dependent hydrolase (beta-lactamase superfamily II)
MPGGIGDFPMAAVHLLEAEYIQAKARKGGYVQKARYRPRQWNEVSDWRTYRPAGERWFGFEAVRELDGLPPEILMVPLPGHTLRQAGVAVRRDDGHWLLHAGDAYFYRGEVRQPKRHCTPGLRAYQTLMNTDGAQQLANQDRVRQLSLEHKGQVSVLCSHDPVEFERCLAGNPL